jgi:TRAP-type mannitol/chloroaromatic compound transport system permease small subunit
MRTHIFAGLRFYVRGVNKINWAVGHFAMLLLVLMLGILTWSIITKGIGQPSIWVMEMAQFTMAAYYLLGAGFSMQQGAHVRMDFLYERWKPRKRSLVDSLTSFFLIFYLVLLVMGGWSSSADALEYGQRNHTVWAPYMAPIKIIMTTGMFLMLLQSTAELIKDICRACGVELLPDNPAPADTAAAQHETPATPGLAPGLCAPTPAFSVAAVPLSAAVAASAAAAILPAAAN